MWWMQHSDRWPPTFGPSWSAWTISPPVGCQLTTLTIAILLLLSPKADTHDFTVPQRVEGWVDLGGWLHTEIVRPQMVTPTNANWAHHRVTVLIDQRVTAKPCHLLWYLWYFLIYQWTAEFCNVTLSGRTWRSLCSMNVILLIDWSWLKTKYAYDPVSCSLLKGNFVSGFFWKLMHIFVS